jgi:outer membrane immunogenic protein
MKSAISTIAAVAALAIGSSAASAADLGRRVVKPGPVVAAAGCFWSGGYLGAHVGYTFSQGKSSSTVGPFGEAPKLEHDKFTGGGYVGYNYCVTPNVVFGIELDATKYGNSGDFTGLVGTTGYGFGHSVDWGVSLRGRLGVTFDRAMVYVTGGLAGVQQDSYAVTRVINTGVNAGFSKSEFSLGYVLGAGIEYAFTPNIVGRAEYLFTDLPKVKYGVGGGTSTDLHTFRLGIAYKF